MLINAMVATDDHELGTRIGRLLEGVGVVASASTGQVPFWEQLTGADIDLVLVSRSLLAEPLGTMVASVRELPEHPEVVVLSDTEDPEDRAALLAAGCLAVVHQRLPDAVLIRTLQALVSRCRAQLLQEAHADATRFSLSDFVSYSPAMQAFLTVAERVVSTDSSLLILGETGVGKERLARAIHADGPRAGGPFVAVNCSALPETLLESELFGHEQGAFTGATRARRGYFELADGGTLFLDEIGELPLHLQVKLLRAIEDRSIQRVGGERSVRVNVRIMAATNRDLEADVTARRFRADLYYRLAVVTLLLPPLRDRPEDIPHLVRDYVERFRAALGRSVTGVTHDAMRCLVTYAWPGNVRELINVLERAMLLSAGPEIDVVDLPSGIAGESLSSAVLERPSAVVPGLSDQVARLPLREARERVAAAFERRYLTELLTATGGRVGETAVRAGVSPRTLYALMQRHHLRKEAFKSERDGSWRPESQAFAHARSD